MHRPFNSAYSLMQRDISQHIAVLQQLVCQPQIIYLQTKSSCCEWMMNPVMDCGAVATFLMHTCIVMSFAHRQHRQ